MGALKLCFSDSFVRLPSEMGGEVVEDGMNESPSTGPGSGEEKTETTKKNVTTHKKKQKRKRKTAQQVEALMALAKVTMRPSKAQREEVAAATGLTITSVYQWFAIQQFKARKSTDPARQLLGALKRPRYKAKKEKKVRKERLERPEKGKKSPEQLKQLRELHRVTGHQDVADKGHTKTTRDPKNSKGGSAIFL